MQNLHALDQQVAAGLRGDFDLGWQLAERMRLENPNCHRAQFNRAWYEMRRGKLLDGLRCLEAGRWEKVFGDQRLPSSKPIYRDEDLTNKYVLMCSEGGLGDELINVRFAKNFAERGAKVVVTCDESLASVFSRVPGVGAVVGHRSAPHVYHDFWVPAMSAAHVLGTEYRDLRGDPYISVHPEYREKWHDLLRKKYGAGRAPKIGLRFYGNPKFEHEQFRRFPPSELVRAVAGEAWVNLQKEESDLPLECWEDTVALIGELDLVITSCTSVAHAAAALGKETWIALPILPYYIWALPGAASPWYKSVRLFRQKKFGEWGSVFDEIQEELGKWKTQRKN